MSEASDQEEGLRRRQGIGVANLREEFERRYGPLWSGASSLSIGGVPHELHEVMHEAGRYAIRFFDGEVRCIVCFEFGADLNYLEEHRVHIAEWLGDAYFETEFQVNCPMDF